MVFSEVSSIGPKGSITFSDSFGRLQNEVLSPVINFVHEPKSEEASTLMRFHMKTHTFR